MEGAGVGEEVLAALEVALFNRFWPRDTLLGAGAFFLPAETFGLGHSRSRLRTSREPGTQSSRRLLKCSQ